MYSMVDVSIYDSRFAKESIVREVNKHVSRKSTLLYWTKINNGQSQKLLYRRALKQFEYGALLLQSGSNPFYNRPCIDSYVSFANIYRSLND